MPPSSRGRAIAGTVLLFALATGWLLVRIYDKDIWFHMLIGREILRRGTIPGEEFYKYPLLGQPAAFHEWGFGVLSELARRTAGWPGLALLNAAVSAGAVLLVAGAALRRGASRSAVVLLLGPLALVASFRFQYRPETMLYLALGATLCVLEAGRWLVLPGLTLGLALFHPSPLILLLVGGAYALDAAVEDRRANPRLFRIAGLLGLSAASVALAPYGLHQLTLPIEFVRRGDLTKVIAEFKPALQTEYRTHVVAVAIAGTLGVVFNPRRRASDVLLLAFFGYLAFAHVRNVALFALVAFGPASMALTRGFARLPSRVGVGGASASLAAATALFLRSPEWGWKPYSDIFPSGTADFILAHRPPGRIVNEMRNGGYLAWRLHPDYLVSVDGRTYYGQDLPMELSGRVLNAEPGWRETVDRYGVTMVATSPVNFMSGELPRAIFELDRDPAWMAVVADVSGVLFVRRGAVDEHLALPRERVWLRVRQVADELAPLMPQSPGVFLTQGMASFRLRDFQRAARDFVRYGQLVPEDRATAALGRLLLDAVAGDRTAMESVEALYARSMQPGR